MSMVGGVLLPGQASAAAEAPEAAMGGIVLSGTPLVHTFDAKRPGETVEAEWKMRAHGDAEFSYEGMFFAVEGGDSALAHALVVEYGVVDELGGFARWEPAGTLAAPLPYSAVTGTSHLKGPSEMTIPVRVTLSDGSVVPPEGSAVVTANFELSYLASSSGGESGTGLPLAATGAPSSFWLVPTLLSAGMIIVGLILRQRDRARGSCGDDQLRSGS